MENQLMIREMKPTDWIDVAEIYKQGFETGNATFQQEIPLWQDWDKDHLSFCRMVAEVNNDVVGWVALSPVSSRCVYGGVAEVSVYISINHRGMKIGRQLLEKLVIESERNKIWTLQAGIFPENMASVKLHESVGFRQIGYREKIGKLRGVWRDNLLLERRSEVVGVE